MNKPNNITHSVSQNLADAVERKIRTPAEVEINIGKNTSREAQQKQKR